MLEPFKHARYAACIARTEPQIAEPKCSSRQFTTVYGITGLCYGEYGSFVQNRTFQTSRYGFIISVLAT
jgi:hypothetical protein